MEGTHQDLPRLLDFAIVGAAKSGTSSLSSLLHGHRDIEVLQPKDSHYAFSLSGQAHWQGPRDEDFTSKILRAGKLHREQLKHAVPGARVGDSSVFYMASREALLALRELMTEDGSVIAVLRRPDDRAFSAYSHMVREGLEPLDFSRALQREEERRAAGWQPIWWYRRLGLYAEQVANIMEIFGPGQVHLIRYEDITGGGAEDVLQAVYDRIGVKGRPGRMVRNNASGRPRSELVQGFLSERNVVKDLGKRVIPRSAWLRVRRAVESRNLQPLTIEPEVRASLIEFYAADVARLEALSGLDLSTWKRQPGDVSV